MGAGDSCLFFLQYPFSVLLVFVGIFLLGCFVFLVSLLVVLLLLALWVSEGFASNPGSCFVAVFALVF